MELLSKEFLVFSDQLIAIFKRFNRASTATERVLCIKEYGAILNENNLNDESGSLLLMLNFEAVKTKSDAIEVKDKYNTESKDIEHTFLRFALQDQKEAMRVITGLFVGLSVFIAGDDAKEIHINGGEGQRNITIHALTETE